VFERFTERARQVVVFAQDEARLLKHNYIGTEHLLLGLLREQEGAAFSVLQSLEVDLADVRDEIVHIVGRGENAPVGAIPFTPLSKRVLELAVREARLLQHDYVGTAHILLGLAVEGGGVAARILVETTENDDICAELVRRLGGNLRRASPRRARRWRVWR